MTNGNSFYEAAPYKLVVHAFKTVTMALLANSKAQIRGPILGLRSQSLSPSTASTSNTTTGIRVTPMARRKASSKSILPFVSAHRVVSSTSTLPSLAFTRSASSSSTPTTSSNYPTTSSSPLSEPTSTAVPPAPQTSTLNWNEYLSLRRSRRRYNLVSSISTSACTTAAGLTALNQNFEYIGSLVGLDPIFTLGIATVSSAGIGWLSGPVLGSAVFNILHRRVRKDMEEVSQALFLNLGRWCRVVSARLMRRMTERKRLLPPHQAAPS